MDIIMVEIEVLTGSKFILRKCLSYNFIRSIVFFCIFKHDKNIYIYYDERKKKLFHGIKLKFYIFRFLYLRIAAKKLKFYIFLTYKYPLHYLYISQQSSTKLQV